MYNRFKCTDEVDYAAQELLVENLRVRGHEVNRFSSASQAIDGLGKY